MQRNKIEPHEYESVLHNYGERLSALEKALGVVSSAQQAANSVAVEVVKQVQAVQEVNEQQDQVNRALQGDIATLEGLLLELKGKSPQE